VRIFLLLIMSIALFAKQTPVKDGTSTTLSVLKDYSLDKYKIIYTVVALADNKHQGIVPISKMLGNGDDARNNLYWGAMYGIKTYFKKSSKWRIIKKIKNPNKYILERIILKHKTSNTIFVADAFRGKNIKKSIIEFLSVVGGKEILSFSKNFKFKKPKLVNYIGHNGLMDFNLDKKIKLLDKGNRDVVILACKSRPYFKDILSKLKVKSMLLTNGFMAPEAYTLHDIIDVWNIKKSKTTIREAAAKAYHKYQKCGMRGARGLFYYKNI